MKKIILIIILLALIAPIGILARTPPNYTEKQQMIYDVINFIYYIFLVATPLLIVIAGFLIFKAGGNPDKVKKGKRLMIYAIIILLLILFPEWITYIFNIVVGVTPTP